MTPMDVAFTRLKEASAVSAVGSALAQGMRRVMPATRAASGAARSLAHAPTMAVPTVARAAPRPATMGTLADGVAARARSAGGATKATTPRAATTIAAAPPRGAVPTQGTIARGRPVEGVTPQGPGFMHQAGSLAARGLDRISGGRWGTNLVSRLGERAIAAGSKTPGQDALRQLGGGALLVGAGGAAAAGATGDRVVHG